MDNISFTYVIDKNYEIKGNNKTTFNNEEINNILSRFVAFDKDINRKIDREVAIAEMKQKELEQELSPRFREVYEKYSEEFGKSVTDKYWSSAIENAKNNNELDDMLNDEDSDTKTK